MTACPVGFLIQGPVTSPKMAVDPWDTFLSFCRAGQRAGETYLSAYCYPPDFREFMAGQRGSVASYTGPLYAVYLWFDIDQSNDPDAALRDVRRLTAGLLDHYPELEPPHVLTFYSGGKGFHVLLPLAHRPGPSVVFHRVCRAMALAVAGVPIDPKVYGPVQLLRAPNSRHPRTGLFKRLVPTVDLARLTISRIRRLARTPLAFDPQWPVRVPPRLRADWQRALAVVVAEPERSGKRRKRTPAKGMPADIGPVPDAFREFFDFDGPNVTAADLKRVAAMLRAWGVPDGRIGPLVAEVATEKGLPARQVERVIGRSTGRLPKYVTDFLLFDADEGTRHPTLFQCAACLSELQYPPAVIRALFSGPAIRCGLKPADADRQIRCGIEHGSGDR